MPADYFFLPRDEVIARVVDGWRSQVWQPGAKTWADYPDLDVAGEANSITPDDAAKRGAQVDDPSPVAGEGAADGMGEFAPEGA